MFKKYLQKEDFVIINTKFGKIRGKKVQLRNKTVFSFTNIPYAQAPIGCHRWKPPIKWYKDYEGVHDGAADNPGPITMDLFNHLYQKRISEESDRNPLQKSIKFIENNIKKLIPRRKQSEDCLYCSIITPTLERKNLPVVIWFQGGHFHDSPEQPINHNIPYNDCLFVTFNFRQGIFGFFQHEELEHESENSLSGNYGIMDQRALLRFIKENIYSYGGNPKNITLWGQGSGANSIMYHIFNPNNKGLFHRAIVHSYANIYDIHTDKRKLGAKICDSLVGQGLNQILRMRQVSALKLKMAYHKYLFNNNRLNFNNCFMPYIDGVTVYNKHTTPPYRVPIIMGIHNNDFYFLYKIGFFRLFDNPLKKEEIKEEDKKILKEEYNIISDFVGHPVKNRYLEDLLFKYPLYDFINNYGLKVYPYILNYTMSACKSYYESEMEYLHHTRNYPKIPYYKIVRIFKIFILSFIKFGDPNKINKSNIFIESRGSIMNYSNTQIYYKPIDISPRIIEVFNKYFIYN